MLLLLVVIGFAALIAMKVIPMYVQYFSIKSTIESVRKEPQLAGADDATGYPGCDPEAFRYRLC